MTKSNKNKKFCTKCSLQFGNTLANFSTDFAFDLHLSTTHKTDVNEEKSKFICDLRGKKFSANGRLIQHFTSVHEGKNLFKCDFYTKSFVGKNSMKIHISLVHEGEKLFKCEFCDYTFAAKARMDQH